MTDTENRLKNKSSLFLFSRNEEMYCTRLTKFCQVLSLNSVPFSACNLPRKCAFEAWHQRRTLPLFQEDHPHAFGKDKSVNFCTPYSSDSTIVRAVRYKVCKCISTQSIVQCRFLCSHDVGNLWHVMLVEWSERLKGRAIGFDASFYQHHEDVCGIQFPTCFNLA